jgi:hypothetical protein
MGLVDSGLLIDRIRRPRPFSKYIIPESFPVTSFGDINAADVVTVGINPSSVEFQSRENLLAMSKKRFVDSETLEIEPESIPTLMQAQQILDGNHSYFKIRPYGWFNWLEKWILEPQGLSYFKDSVAHLDLVQWATKPVWSGIKDVQAQQVLVEHDRRFLSELLDQKKPSLVLLNGKTAVDTFASHGLFSLETNYELYGADQLLTVSRGTVNGQPAIGWNMFLQSQRTNKDRQILSDEIVRISGKG